MFAFPFAAIAKEKSCFYAFTKERLIKMVRREKYVKFAVGNCFQFVCADIIR